MPVFVGLKLGSFATISFGGHVPEAFLNTLLLVLFCFVVPPDVFPGS